MHINQRRLILGQRRRGPQAVLALVSIVGLILGLSLAVPVAVAAPHPQEASATAEATPSGTPVQVATPSGTPGQEATPGNGPEQTKTPAVTATPAGPTPTPTISPTPRSGLVLVPLAVRPAAPTPNLPDGVGMIRGRVIDSGGRGLNGQTVRLTQGGFLTTVLTDGDGRYEVIGLQPGQYSVVVDKQICSPVDGVAVTAGAASEVEFVEVRSPAAPAASARTPMPTNTRVATATRTATPRPTATATVTATATPRPGATQRLDVRIGNLLGLDVEIPNVATPFYAGLLGGVIFVVVGIVVAFIRR